MAFKSLKFSVLLIESVAICIWVEKMLNPFPTFQASKAGRLVRALRDMDLTTNLEQLAFRITDRNRAWGEGGTQVMILDTLWSDMVTATPPSKTP